MSHCIEEMDEMPRDNGSQDGFTSIPLPPLGVTAAAASRPQLPTFIISPSNRIYREWETFLVVLAFYSSWICAFEIAFLNEPMHPFPIVDDMVNGLFLVDMGLTFFVAYVDNATYVLVYEPKDIMLRYVKSLRLFLDFASCVPSELAYVSPSFLKMYVSSNPFRLWRFHRIFNMLTRLERNINLNYVCVRTTKLLVIILFAVHLEACSFYFVATHYIHHSKTTWIGTISTVVEKDLTALYILSVYLSMATLSTVGFGDVHPVNTREMALANLFMLLNLGLVVYFTANMTNLLAPATSRTTKYREAVQAVTGFVRRNQLPVHLKEQMLSHLLTKYKIALEEVKQQEIIDCLPKPIQSTIAHHLFSSLVDKMYLFRGVSDDLLSQLVSEMKVDYYSPTEDVILQNEAPTYFYLFVTGAADLITRKDGIERVVGAARSGDLVGETEVLCSRPQRFTVRTRALSQILRLGRTTFLDLVKADAENGTIIMNNFLNHLQTSRLDAVLTETEAMLDRGKMDLPISTWFAANRNYDKLLRRLLENGSDPNEADRNGRTALHIAAYKGNEHWVSLLLKHGADPNRKDLDGSVPLWEAMMKGHESVKTLLKDNGAHISYNDEGRQACSAVELNNLELLKELIQYGVDVTQPRRNGTTALHAAVIEGNAEIVRFLVEQGADIDKQDDNGWTPRGFAEQLGHEEIINIFENFGL